MVEPIISHPHQYASPHHTTRARALLGLLVATALLPWPPKASAQSVNVTYDGRMYGGWVEGVSGPPSRGAARSRHLCTDPCAASPLFALP